MRSLFGCKYFTPGQIIRMQAVRLLARLLRIPVVVESERLPRLKGRA